MTLQNYHLQAGNSLSDKEQLRELHRSADREVRLRLAENPSSPPDILSHLSKDFDPEVRGYVACNPSTPPEVVENLSYDEHSDVRYFMAGDPHLPLDILRRLAHDANPYVSDCAQKTVAGLALELALEEQGFVSFPGIHARLGELLVAGGITNENEIEASLVLAKDMRVPLGRALVHAGRLDVSTIVFALKLQTLIRLGQVSLEMAIEEIRKYGKRQQHLA